jgi:hypothetical protein
VWIRNDPFPSRVPALISIQIRIQQETRPIRIKKDCSIALLYEALRRNPGVQSMVNWKTYKKLTIYRVTRGKSVSLLRKFNSGYDQPWNVRILTEAGPHHGISIRTHYTLNQCWGSGSASAVSGSRRAKNTHRKRKKKKFHVYKCSMFSSEGWNLLL